MLRLWRGPGLVARSLLRGDPGQPGGWVNLRAEPGGRGVAFTRHHVKTDSLLASLPAPLPPYRPLASLPGCHVSIGA